MYAEDCVLCDAEVGTIGVSGSETFARNIVHHLHNKTTYKKRVLYYFKLR